MCNRNTIITSEGERALVSLDYNEPSVCVHLERKINIFVKNSVCKRFNIDTLHYPRHRVKEVNSTAALSSESLIGAHLHSERDLPRQSDTGRH